MARFGVGRSAEGRQPPGPHQQDVTRPQRHALRIQAGGEVLGGGAVAAHRRPVATGAGEMARQVGQDAPPGHAMRQRLVDAVAAVRPMHDRGKRGVVVEAVGRVGEMRQPIPLRAGL